MARFDSALRAPLTATGALLLFVASSARADDSFFGADKALHFSASAGIAAAAYGGAGLFKAPVQGRLTAAIALALMAGVGKELLDVRGLGDPSPLDLAWDVLGTLTGAALAYVFDWLFFAAAATPSGPAESPAR